MKLKWKVGEKPTGRYRSFQNRAWPSAEYSTGDHAGHIGSVGDRSYHVSLTMTEELQVYVACRDQDKVRFTNRRLKGTFRGLDAAKAALQSFLDRHPEHWPEGVS